MLQVLDLESGSEPDVVLPLATFGGARCCLVEQVFSFDPAAMTYVESQRNFTATGAGARVEDLAHDGHYEFVSSDASFFGAFADLEASAEPVQIWSFGALRFHNVTCTYPRAIAKDAAAWLHEFNHRLSNGEGYIAAWAADEGLLGNSKLVNETLGKELHKGDLRASDPFAGGAKFVTALHRFLRTHGYARACES